MRHSQKLLAGVSAAALVSFGAGGVLAQDWTGGYIGGHAGTGFGAFTDGAECYDQDGEIDVWYSVFMLVEEPGDDLDPGGDCYWNVFAGSLDPLSPVIADTDDSYFWWEAENDPIAQGHLVGAQMGFRFQAGTMVFGAEVAHSLTLITQFQEGWAEGQVEVYFPGEDAVGLGYFDVAVQGTIAMTSLTTATTTLGFAVGTGLVYAEAGLAMGQFSYSNTLGFNGTTPAFGWVAGGGVEVRINDRISIFGEYNRVQFNNIQMLGQSSLTVFSKCCNEVLTSPGLPTLIDMNFGANIFKIGFNIGL
jgi:opacity protein-like surface antigen